MRSSCEAVWRGLAAVGTREAISTEIDRLSSHMRGSLVDGANDGHQ